MSESEIAEIRGKKPDLSSSDVVTKYKAAAKILNDALKLVVSECMPNAKISDICEKGDDFIERETAKVFKKVERGIGFPTCVCVNNIICNYCPHSIDSPTLKENDVVKIEMSCHIDGFVAVVAHTKVIANGPIMGRAADVLAAANTAANVAFKLVRPGNKVKDVVEAVNKVADTYGCKIVEGTLPPYKMQQYDIDSNADGDDIEFEVCQVYAVNIVTSSGTGKAKCFDDMKTTVFRRAVDKGIHLERSASKLFLEISQKFPRMPFTTRAIVGDYSSFDYLNCTMHGLLHPYHVAYENEGELVAQIKFTVLLMPNRSDKITTYGLQELVPTISIDADSRINTWLSLSTKTKKKGGGKRRKGKKDHFFGDPFFFQELPSALQFKILACLPLKSFACCRAINKHFSDMLSDHKLL